MASRMGSLDLNMALSLHSGSGLLVEGEEVSTIESVAKQLEDPKMIELLELAGAVEISLSQSIDGESITVIAFVEYPDKRLVLAVSHGNDLYSVTLEALEKAVERLKDCED